MAYVQRNEKDTSQWSNSAFDTPAIQREWNVAILDIFKNNMQIIIWIVALVGSFIIGVKFDLETFPLFVCYFIFGFLMTFIYKKHEEAKEREKMDRIYNELEREYKKALQNWDKPLALELGRKYYSFYRPDGKSTLYDEQAIANDLASIDD